MGLKIGFIVKRIFVAGAAAAISLPLFAGTDGGVLRVDCTKKICDATPFLFGTCLEDLNREVYGGLYAQTIMGECFEEVPEGALPEIFSPEHGLWRTMPTHTECEPCSEGSLLFLNSPSFGEGKIEVDIGFGYMKATPFIMLNADTPAPDGKFTGYKVQIKPFRDGVVVKKCVDGVDSVLGEFDGKSAGGDSKNPITSEADTEGHSRKFGALIKYPFKLRCKKGGAADFSVSVYGDAKVWLGGAYFSRRRNGGARTFARTSPTRWWRAA